MCATVFYRKVIKGRLYPKVARTGPYAFAQEVSRVGSKVVTRYLGIVRIPKGVVVESDGQERAEAEKPFLVGDLFLTDNKNHSGPLPPGDYEVRLD